MRKKLRAKITKRDEKVLMWIGEMYAVREDQIQRLLGRETDRATKTQGVLSAETTQHRVKKWVELGLVKREKIFTGQPAWVWLTARGLGLFEEDYRGNKQPSLYQLRNHYYWLNEVRMNYEQYYAERGHSIEWRSERRIIYEFSRSEEKKKRHLPDAEVILPTRLIAVELELTKKTTPDRLETILKDLVQHYELTWYFCGNEHVKEFIEEKRDSCFSPEDQEKVECFLLKEIKSS